MSRSRRPGALIVMTEHDSGRETHMDAVTCCHCQRIVHFQGQAQLTERTGWCLRCMRATCLAPACANCAPWERQMEASEARGRFLRSAGLGG